MLKVYYNHISPNARRVWLTLLEKDIPFEGVFMKLDGDQLESEFLAVNPFHHIPVLVDGDFKLVESLAILDYLEAKYPQPTLLPTEAKDLAIVRMVQMITGNELFPNIVLLMCEPEDSQSFGRSKQEIDKVLNFLLDLLGDRPYFGSQQLTLADIVAGVAIPLLPRLGVRLDRYPQIDAWSQRLQDREVWRKTEISDADFELFKRRVKFLVTMRRRAMSRS